MLYIRYVGMAGRGRTGWDRLVEDEKSRKGVGILGAFLDEICNRYPEVHDNSTCHEVVNLTYPDSPQPEKTLIDDRERMMIALLDRRVLLNQQPGGYYGAYTPLASDHTLFAKLGTNYFETFARNVDTDMVQQHGIRVQVTNWANSLREYAIANPVETLSDRFELTETYVDSVIKSQALPALVRGRAVLAMFGKDVTIEDLRGGNPFLSGPSRAGHLTMEILTKLHQFEHAFAAPLVQPFVDGQFPFVDLFPWIGKAASGVCAEFARQYFAIIQPRIIVTFSRLVSSWTASNFVHSDGFPRFYLIISF